MEYADCVLPLFFFFYLLSKSDEMSGPSMSYSGNSMSFSYCLQFATILLGDVCS